MTAPWWQTALLYQVYPRSFADADGDGIGDLRGIASRLDYIADLGADAIWLSPIFRSPMADFGYDVADYCDVDPLFGSLDDLDRLIADAHARGLKVILDFVPNHSSDEHPWFVESRSSRTSPKRDWYVWRDALPDGSAPNNWVSFFGGSTWEWDEETEQYYLHLFDRKQPDLNWRNPEVRAAMYDVMRFWLDRGVDGFRIDVLWLLIKHAEFVDNPPAEPMRDDETEWTRYDRPAFEDRPETHEIVREMRALADAYDDRVLIGEIYLPLARLVTYYGETLDGIHLPFNFSLVTMGSWDAGTIRRLVDAYEAALPEGGWPNWVLGNHDMPRVATRSGPAARLAQMLLLTLRGTATAYYGDELGMEDVPIAPELAVDPQAAVGRNRDPVRTPMQWDDGPNAGFAPPRRAAVAAAGGRPTASATSRRSARTRGRCWRSSARSPTCDAGRRRCTWARTARWTRATTSSRTCASRTASVCWSCCASRRRRSRSTSRARAPQARCCWRPASSATARSTSPASSWPAGRA